MIVICVLMTSVSTVVIEIIRRTGYNWLRTSL